MDLKYLLFFVLVKRLILALLSIILLSTGVGLGLNFAFSSSKHQSSNTTTTPIASTTSTTHPITTTSPFIGTNKLSLVIQRLLYGKILSNTMALVYHKLNKLIIRVEMTYGIPLNATSLLKSLMSL